MAGHSDALRLAYTHYIADGRRHLADLQMTDATLRIYRCLIADQRPWTISAISEASGLSRMTVRSRIRDAKTAGRVEKSVGGYRVTEMGLAYFRETFDEFFARVKVPLLKFHRVLARECPDLLANDGEGGKV